MRRLQRGRSFDLIGWVRWLLDVESRLGVTGVVALLAIAALAIAVAMMEEPQAAQDIGVLLEHVERTGREPAALIGSAASAHRLVVLGEVSGSRQALDVGVRSMKTIARSSGLDAVVVDAPITAQPLLDRYLESRPEDTGPLLLEPAALAAEGRDDRGLLDLYRAVRELNDDLGADRRIRLVAAGPEDWPAQGAASPRRLSRRYAERSRIIAETVVREILEPEPRARVFLYLRGLDAVHGLRGQLSAGGGDPVSVRWVADLLRESEPREVFSVLMDAGRRPAGSAGGVMITGPGYDGTRFYSILRGELDPATTFATRPGDGFDFLADPLFVRSGSGITMRLEPSDYRLGDVVDGYVFLGEPVDG